MIFRSLNCNHKIGQHSPRLQNGAAIVGIYCLLKRSLNNTQSTTQPTKTLNNSHIYVLLMPYKQSILVVPPSASPLLYFTHLHIYMLAVLETKNINGNTNRHLTRVKCHFMATDQDILKHLSYNGGAMLYVHME